MIIGTTATSKKTGAARNTAPVGVVLLLALVGKQSVGFVVAPRVKPPAPIIGGRVRAAPLTVPKRLERTASYSWGTRRAYAASGSSKSLQIHHPERRTATAAASAFSRARAGTLRGKARRDRGTGSSAASSMSSARDWSKLFATPEPETSAVAKPLVGLSRRFASLAEPSCGSTPLYFALVGLIGVAFTPILSAQSLGVWCVGKLLYALCMVRTDESHRLSAGFIGSMALFFVVGGLAFMNALKAIAVSSLLNT